MQHLSGLDLYFAAARGVPGSPALDMSKVRRRVEWSRGCLLLRSTTEMRTGGCSSDSGSVFGASVFVLLFGWLFGVLQCFDSNYHTLVPELSSDSVPSPNWSGLLDKVKRGQAVVGKDRAVPILVGEWR